MPTPIGNVNQALDQVPVLPNFPNTLAWLKTAIATIANGPDNPVIYCLRINTDEDKLFSLHITEEDAYRALDEYIDEHWYNDYDNDNDKPEDPEELRIAFFGEDQLMNHEDDTFYVIMPLALVLS